jgi:hypothetical protein
MKECTNPQFSQIAPSAEALAQSQPMKVIPVVFIMISRRKKLVPV